MKNPQILTATLAAVLLGVPAHAASTTGTITVIANVQNSCTLSGGSGANAGDTTADFGTYNPTTGNTVIVSGSSVVSVNCSLGTLYTASLGAGQNDQSGQRRLKHTVDSSRFLNYSLGIVGAGGILNSVIGVNLPFVGTGTAVPIVIQGSLASGQDSLSGNYQDQVTLTITY